MSHVVKVAGLKVGAGQPLFLIAGPCVIESEEHALKLASAEQPFAVTCAMQPQQRIASSVQTFASSCPLHVATHCHRAWTFLTSFKRATLVSSTQ